MRHNVENSATDRMRTIKSDEGPKSIRGAKHTGLAVELINLFAAGDCRNLIKIDRRV